AFGAAGADHDGRAGGLHHQRGPRALPAHEQQLRPAAAPGQSAPRQAGPPAAYGGAGGGDDAAVYRGARPDAAAARHRRGGRGRRRGVGARPKPRSDGCGQRRGVTATAAGRLYAPPAASLLYATAMSAATWALFTTRATLAARLRPPLSCFTRSSTKGVTALPAMPCSSASRSAR